jgi:hypothetical protein
MEPWTFQPRKEGLAHQDSYGTPIYFQRGRASAPSPVRGTLPPNWCLGVDTRTPVDDKDYQVPFRFTGKIGKVTFKLGPTQLTSEDHQIIQHAFAKAND